MKKIKSTAAQIAEAVNLSSTKFIGFMAAALIAGAATVCSAVMAEAQSIPIGLGIDLGRGLFSAANRHRHSNAYSDPGYGYSGGGYCGSRQSRNAAISAYNRSIKYFNAKQYEEAMPLLMQAIQIDPQMGSAYALLAVCQSKTGRLQEAMQNFETAKNYNNHYQTLLYEEGMCAARLRDYRMAVSCLQQYVGRGREEAQASEAEKALAIVRHNFAQQSDDDYLSDASKEGARRWGNVAEPLRVYIKDDPTLRGYHPEFAAIVKQAFDEWQQGTNGKVVFVYTADPSQAQIKVSWTDNEADLGTGAAKELGITYIVFSDGVIESADIKLHTLVGVCRDDATELFPQAKSVALHEIGHALGLQHSAEPYDTMYPLVPPKGFEFSLTKRDLNTVVALYSKNQPQLTSMENMKYLQHTELSAQKSR